MKLSPLKAIRSNCVWCCNSAISGPDSPTGCNSPACSLYSRRMGKGAGPGALRAIRARCLECAGSNAEVRDCPIQNCPLWPYRRGHNPSLAGKTKKVSERFLASRNARSQRIPSAKRDEPDAGAPAK